MENLPVYPVGLSLHILPQGIVQLAISTLRYSNCSDEEIAAYACNTLALILEKNNFVITKKENSLSLLVFAENRNQ